MASFQDARKKSVTHSRAELLFKCFYKPCTLKQTCSTSVICPLFLNTAFAIALWQIRLFSFLMLHFICSHFLSLNNSSIRFWDAVICRPCCNCSNEARLKRERIRCRGNPSPLPGYDSPHPSEAGDSIPELVGLRSWGVPAERTGIVAKPAFAIQQSLLPSEGISCSSNSLRSDLIFYSNKGLTSRASSVLQINWLVNSSREKNSHLSLP